MKSRKVDRVAVAVAVQERIMTACRRLTSARAWSTAAPVRPACREPRAPAGFVLRICGARARPLASAGNGRRGRRANDRVSASIWWLIVTNRSDGNAARTQRSRLAAATQPTGVCASSRVASTRRAVYTRHPRPCMMSPDHKESPVRAEVGHDPLPVVVGEVGGRALGARSFNQGASLRAHRVQPTHRRRDCA